MIQHRRGEQARTRADCSAAATIAQLAALVADLKAILEKSQSEAATREAALMAKLDQITREMFGKSSEKMPPPARELAKGKTAFRAESSRSTTAPSSAKFAPLPSADATFTSRAPSRRPSASATPYTLVDNAKRLGRDPFGYHNDILRRLELGFVIRDVALLTPTPTPPTTLHSSP